MNTNYEKPSKRPQSRMGLGALLLAGTFLAFHQQSYSEGSRFNLLKKHRLELREISGLSFHKGVLTAASDHDWQLMQAEVKVKEDGQLQLGEAKRLELKQPADLAKEDSQWEALHTDGDGKHILLRESSSEVFVYSAKGELLNRYQLEAPEQPKGRKAASFEGLLALSGSHLLLADEKAPLTLIEYGPQGGKAKGVQADTILAPDQTWIAPAGSRLVPLARWDLAESGCGASDLARAEDGGLLVLGKKCTDLIHINRLDPAQSDMKVSHSWPLLKGIARTEALAPLPGVGLIIAQDKNKVKKNLLIFKQESAVSVESAPLPPAKG